MLRTAAITFTYAIATGLTARAGPAAAACHQVRVAAATGLAVSLGRPYTQAGRCPWITLSVLIGDRAFPLSIGPIRPVSC